jgi:murein DD-endopeptidase MepM/ murein hydrolase activator NlpD
LFSFVYFPLRIIYRFTFQLLRDTIEEIQITHRQNIDRNRGHGTVKHKFRQWREDYSAPLRFVFNLVLPLVAIGLVAFVASYMNSRFYALRVDFNGITVGYAKNEDSVDASKDIAAQHMYMQGSGSDAETGSVVANLDAVSPTYTILVATPGALVDENTLSQRILDNSEEKMTMACGVKVDGQIVAAIKNETDARSVLDSIKSRAQISLSADLQKGDKVEFVEDVQLEQLAFSENYPKMYDARQLNEMLSGVKEGEVWEPARANDSVESIANRHGTTEEHLLALNPQFRNAYLHEGEKVITSLAVPYLQVQVVRTQTREENVAFETEQIKTDKLLQGAKRTVVAGVYGKNLVTERVTYLNGVISGAAELISRVRILDPVTEKVEIGTKSNKVTYHDTVITITSSSQGFVWPVPSLHQISSPYGYRSRGFHKGIDITGSGASGKLIVAAKDGVVEQAIRGGSSYGYMLLINHGNGVKTRYAHMVAGSFMVGVGDRVSAGQPIGRVGSTGNSTGPHLHFEVIINGNTQNPVHYVRR